MAAQVVKKKTWKEMRDEVFDRSQRYLAAGMILFFVSGLSIVIGLSGLVISTEALFKWIWVGVIVSGIVCFAVIAPICLIVSLKLDKKLNRI